MKKVTKKIISVLLAVSVIFGTGINAYAATQDDLEVRERTIVSELMADGLSKKDAEYYAALDTMIRQMERTGEVLQLGDAVEAMDVDTALENQALFRARVLEKDPAAVKCALTMTSSLLGQQEMQALTATYQDQNEYTIVYPDGSKITYSSGTNEIKNPESLYASGTSSETFGSGTITQYTNYTGYGEYKMTSGVNYSKNRVDVEYTYASTGVTMTYAEGSQSSYGVVLISNSNSGEISREKSTSTKPAEANNQVIYQISGSVGGSVTLVGYEVSVSISGGANWTQTVYFRVKKNGDWSAVASTYV